VITEMFILVLCVTLLAQAKVLTVSALVEISNDRFLSTVITSNVIMSHRSIEILCLVIVLKFEVRKDGC
jgi:hypothetical protein